VNRRMIDLLDLGPEPFTAICIAPERPDEPPVYRKPSPRFITEMLAAHAVAAEQAWMVGDSPVDWEAGLAAGVRVAAVVSGPEAGEVRQRRLALGVEAYPGLRDWWAAVSR